MITADLIGLEYGWGHAPNDGSGKTDCFQLVCELHKRFGYADYTTQFAWAYTKYTRNTLPVIRIARWLLENGSRLDYPKPGAITLMPSEVTGALGTVMDDYTTMFIGPSNTVIRIALPANSGQHFWMDK